MQKKETVAHKVRYFRENQSFTPVWHITLLITPLPTACRPTRQLTEKKSPDCTGVLIRGVTIQSITHPHGKLHTCTTQTTSKNTLQTHIKLQTRAPLDTPQITNRHTKGCQGANPDINQTTNKNTGVSGCKPLHELATDRHTPSAPLTAIKITPSPSFT